jgi:hypothetical protein
LQDILDFMIILVIHNEYETWYRGRFYHVYKYCIKQYVALMQTVVAMLNNLLLISILYHLIESIILWHVCWKPELRSKQTAVAKERLCKHIHCPLLGNGPVNVTWLRPRLRTQQKNCWKRCFLCDPRRQLRHSTIFLCQRVNTATRFFGKFPDCYYCNFLGKIRWEGRPRSYFRKPIA